MKHLILMIISYCLILGSANAITNNTVDVYFINGINTTQSDFEKSRDTLIKKFGTSINGKTLNYSDKYLNPTEDFFKDLEQAYGQAIKDGQLSGPVDSLWNVFYAFKDRNKINYASVAYTIFSEWFKNNALKSIPVSDTLTAKMIEYFKESLDGGREVLLVAHSQSNFYANAA